LDAFYRIAYCLTSCCSQVSAARESRIFAAVTLRSCQPCKEEQTLFPGVRRGQPGPQAGAEAPGQSLPSFIRVFSIQPFTLFSSYFAYHYDKNDENDCNAQKT